MRESLKFHNEGFAGPTHAALDWDIDKQLCSDDDSQKVPSYGANREAGTTEPTNP